jgi:TonB family protein
MPSQAGALTPRANTWLLRASAIAAIIIVHAAILYAIRISPYIGGDFPMLLGAELSSALAGKSVDRHAAEHTAPDRRWKFPPFDVWPSDPGNAPRMSELSSASGAEAVPNEAEAPIRASTSSESREVARTNLGILRWVRPAYPAQWAQAGKEGSVVVSVHINDRGRPLEVTIVRGSGATELDASALSAVQKWTFTPPFQNLRPVSAWAEIELRFNR